MNTITVRIADFAVGASDAVLVTNGIGSCVAIALYDPSARVGALAHVLLPNEMLSASSEPAGRCASSAVPVMVRRIRELQGAGELQARLIGGASMFAPLLIPGALSLGARNIASARAALAVAEIPVVGEDVGGDHGRSVRFDLASGSLVVASVAKGDVRL